MIGNCSGTPDPEIFFDSTRWARASKVCKGCPIMMECREAFARDGFAFAGGMTPNKRAAWLREREREATVAAREEVMQGRKRGPYGQYRVTAEKIDEILAVFDTELIGTKAIADRVGVSKSTAQRILRQHGRKRTEAEELEMARLGGLSGGQKRLGEYNETMVMQLFADGYSIPEVCAAVGIQRNAVYYIRRRVVRRWKGEYAADVVAKMSGLPVTKIEKLWSEG